MLLIDLFVCLLNTVMSSPPRAHMYIRNFHSHQGLLHALVCMIIRVYAISQHAGYEVKLLLMFVLCRPLGLKGSSATYVADDPFNPSG